MHCTGDRGDDTHMVKSPCTGILADHQIIHQMTSAGACPKVPKNHRFIELQGSGRPRPSRRNSRIRLSQPVRSRRLGCVQKIPRKCDKLEIFPMSDLTRTGARSGTNNPPPTHVECRRSSPLSGRADPRDRGKREEQERRGRAVESCRAHHIPRNSLSPANCLDSDRHYQHAESESAPDEVTKSRSRVLAGPMPERPFARTASRALRLPFRFRVAGATELFRLDD